MRIAFIVIGNSRRSNYLNGYTLRYGGAGGSGTDSSVILVAEYLSKNGHSCVIAMDDLEIELKNKYEKKYKLGEEIMGVQYTNKKFTGIRNKKFDVLVSMLWFEDYKSLPIKVTKSLIYWSHMQWIYGLDSIINFVNSNNLSLRFVNVSEWEKSMNHLTMQHICAKVDDCDSIVIPNPIMDDVLKEVLDLNINKKKNKFIFHASWPRGGDISLEAVRQLNLPDLEFHAFDYLMVTHDHKDSFFYKHDGVDKKTLFKHLAESEYFIYPLYTPYQDVHKDTFSCVVAEAIALGVTVITYPLGALYENYKDYCQWLQLPLGFDLETVQNESLTKDLDGKFKMDENIVHMIHYLEQNPQVKNLVKENGYNYITSKYKLETVGNMWLNYIKNLVI
jgi:glycosyltransferase involved in cell wall biosynthesis